MKKEIDKLVELAREYAYAGIRAGLPNQHNYLRERYANKKAIMIYFSENKTVQLVQFCDIEIRLFADKIYMPFNADKAHLESVYNDALEFYSEYFKK